MQFGNKIKNLWLLDENVTFLNHGSFGACPKVVLEESFNIMRKLETEPISFFIEGYYEAIRSQAAALGKFVNADPDSLVFVENATTGMNTVLHSLMPKLKRGDEIIITNHVYPAVRAALKFLKDQTGVVLKEINLPYPVYDISEYTEIYKNAITPQTKLALVDHVIYTTGVIAPVKEIAEVMHKNNMLVLVDGAHAPGMLDLNIEDLNVDWYTGNLHKWMFTPKGVALLWTAPEHQSYTKPLTISFFYETGYYKEFDWQGTKNPTSILAVTKAIEFINTFGKENIINYIHDLAIQARDLVTDKLNIDCKIPNNYFASLVALPYKYEGEIDYMTTNNIRGEFFRKYKIEMPFVAFDGRMFFRFSTQIYNDIHDYEKLAEALKDFGY